MQTPTLTPAEVMRAWFDAFAPVAAAFAAHAAACHNLTAARAAFDAAEGELDAHDNSAASTAPENRTASRQKGDALREVARAACDKSAAAERARSVAATEMREALENADKAVRVALNDAFRTDEAYKRRTRP